MSLISTLARLEACAAGRAEPLASVRHRHLTERPMVLVPLTTAGEAGAPLGAMVGTDPGEPVLLTVPQPRDRELRFAFLAKLAAVMLPHLESAQDNIVPEQRRATDPESGKRVTVDVELCADAPQLLVPNESAVAYVRLLGRSMRFRRTAEEEPEGQRGPRACAREEQRGARGARGVVLEKAAQGGPERAVREEPARQGTNQRGATRPAAPAVAPVPLLGRWLTHYGERARVPGSALLLSMTALLTRHWATGQSHLEDQHLHALLAWIDPPEGVSGAEAALRAERERDRDGVPVLPPAGPATDPAFDNRRLAPAVGRYDAARSAAARGRAEAEIRELLGAQLRPAWDAMWQGVELLRALPEGASVADRWKSDRWSYTGHRDRVRAGEPPQPRRDDAVTAARKLAARETAQARLAAQEALDDPLVMAERRLAGEAFVGEVTEVAEGWSEGRRPMPRPLVTLVTDDSPQADEGAKVHRALAEGRTQTGEIVRLEPPADGGPGTASIVVRLTGGMGRGKVPAPGSVPAKGDRVCWTLFEHLPRSGPELPAPEDTPWTHGGPQLAGPTAVREPEPDPVTGEDYL